MKEGREEGRVSEMSYADVENSWLYALFHQEHRSCISLIEQWPPLLCLTPPSTQGMRTSCGVGQTELWADPSRVCLFPDSMATLSSMDGLQSLKNNRSLQQRWFVKKLALLCENHLRVCLFLIARKRTSWSKCNDLVSKVKRYPAC